MTRRTASAAPGLSEADFQRRVTDYCDVLRLRWHHEVDSRRSKSGFPDLVIAGPGGVAFVELKTDDGRLSTEQVAWLGDLRRGGAEAFVWRPSTWTEAAAALRDLARPTATVTPITRPSAEEGWLAP